MWSKVQLQFVDYLKNWRTDLGGKKNFHNGTGGTYDCIAVLSCYKVCKEVASFKEIEQIVENITLPSFKRLRFVDLDKPIYKNSCIKPSFRLKNDAIGGMITKWRYYL